MREDDVDYYRRRAEAETRLAERAARPEAVSAHYRLATLYFERLESSDAPKAMSRG